jgi:outer membrane lipoprotein-sorting protein
MRDIFYLLFFLFFFLIQREIYAEEKTLASIQKFFRDPDGIILRFEQVNISSAFPEPTTQKGWLALRGDRFRFEYLFPDPQTFYVDGKEFLWIQPEEKQVVLLPLEKAFQSPQPLLFLREFRNIQEVYRIEKKRKERGRTILTLKPMEPDPFVEKMVVEWDQEKPFLHRMEMVDPLGNQILFRFFPYPSPPSLDSLFPPSFPPDYKRFTPPVP